MRGSLRFVMEIHKLKNDQQKKHILASTLLEIDAKSSFTEVVKLI